MKTTHTQPSDLVALEVEINTLRWIVFAVSKPKAQMLATSCYWDAYGRRMGEWPRAVAKRAERHDNSPHRYDLHRQAWSESDL